MSSILIDTNLLLDDPTIIFKLSKEYDKIVISITVLKELDKHKLNPDLSYSARQAINAISEFKEKYRDRLDLYMNDDDISSNDLKIIRAAKETGSEVATKDISMGIMSESSGVKCRMYGNVANGIYNPYLTMSVVEIPVTFAYAQLYQNDEYKAIFDIMLSNYKFKDSEWFFIFINDNEDTKAVYANNPELKELVRIDNTPKYWTIDSKAGSFKIKAKDHYQVCAIYALKSSKNVLITGKWGSGKSLLATAHAVSENPKKTFISRPPIGIDAKYNIGFLPGDTRAKLDPWAMGFLSATYYLFGNTKAQDVKFDFVKDEIFRDMFELIDSNSLQGLSLLDDYLLVDEVQYCTIDLMSMILSRANEESRVIMTGDLAQSYSIKPSNSGLLKLLRAMPHKSMAYVDLKNSYRSDLLDLAEKLQDKAF